MRFYIAACAVVKHTHAGLTPVSSCSEKHDLSDLKDVIRQLVHKSRTSVSSTAALQSSSQTIPELLDVKSMSASIGERKASLPRDSTPQRRFSAADAGLICQGYMEEEAIATRRPMSRKWRERWIEDGCIPALLHALSGFPSCMPAPKAGLRRATWLAGSSMDAQPLAICRVFQSLFSDPVLRSSAIRQFCAELHAMLESSIAPVRKRDQVGWGGGRINTTVMEVVASCMSDPPVAWEASKHGLVGLLTQLLRRSISPARMLDPGKSMVATKGILAAISVPGSCR